MDWLKFIGFIFICVYPVGYLVLSGLIKPVDRRLAASIALGLFTVSLEIYIVGIFGWYSLSVPLVLLQGPVAWLIIITKKDSAQKKFFKIPAVAWLFIIIALYTNSLLLVPFGQETKAGISLYGAHYVDSTWHLSLVNNLIKSVPPENPIYSGTKLSSYHYLVDLQISLIHQTTGIPVPKLYFYFIGPLYLLLLTVLIYRLSYSMTKSILSGISAVTLLQLGSNIYYLFGSNPSIAWIDFFSTKVVNYPLLFSLILILIFLEAVSTKLTYGNEILLGLLSGALFMVKSHTALVWIVALIVYDLYRFATKHYTHLFSLVTTLIVLSVLYFSTVGSGQVLAFSPLWFIKTMYESPDRLNGSWWELSRQTLIAANSHLGIIKLYLIGFTTFFAVNFHILIAGLTVRKLPKIYTVMALIGIIIPMLFIQRGAAWNSIQFTYPVFIPLIIGFSLLIAKVYLKNRMVGLLFFIVIFAGLLPGNTYIARQYISYAGKQNISSELVSLIKFLKDLPENSIIVDETFRSGSVIQAYSGKSLYLGDRQMLESLSINTVDRDERSSRIINCRIIDPDIDYAVISSDSNQIKKCATLLKSFDSILVYQFN